VTGTVDVVNDVANDDGIDFQELDKSIVSTLTSLFEEQHSDSATSFLVSLQYAKDNALGMAIDVELSLTKAVEKQLPVANALVQDDVVSDKSFTDSLYFFIACGGFGAVILLIGFLIHSTRSKAKEKAIEQKIRSAKSTNRKKFTNRSSNNNRVDDDHDHPALEYLDNACSSLMSVVDDNKSGGSVDTQDLLEQWVQRVYAQTLSSQSQNRDHTPTLRQKPPHLPSKPRSRSATATHRSFDPSPCNSLVSANDDKSSNDGVGTSDLQWQCGLASVCTDLEFSRPKRRPYPYAVTAGSGSVNGKESKASDMSLRMSKSTMSIRH